MRRLMVALALASAVAGAIACASSDGGSGPGSWNAEQSSAILSPANDTRTNLLLLLADRHGSAVADPSQMTSGIVPIEFDWSLMEERLSPPAPEHDYGAAYGEMRAQYGLSENGNYFGFGSDNIALCHSNRSGAEQFTAALNADRSVPGPEKAVLIAARQMLATACDKAAGLTFALDDVSSRDGLAYARYLHGARLFYAEDFPAAEERFAAAADSSSRWVADTASYMLFRTALATATGASIDKYGELAKPEERDRAAIDRADTVRREYLRAYPAGLYASSARNLERRISWLRGDRQALGAAYSAMVGSPAARDGADANVDMIHEIDRKLLPDGEDVGVTDPTLLAVVDLMRLRQDGREESYDWGYRGKKLERAELERQRPYFKSNPALFDYLLAVEAFYGRKQPNEVLALIPDAAHRQRFGYVQFSRQMLRGFALDAVDDPKVRGFWLSLLPGATQPYQREAVELALANHDRKTRRIDALFAEGSPLRHPLIRQYLLEEAAGPALLRRQAKVAPGAHEREVSLYLLLAGELHHGLYADFIKDLALVGPRKPPSDESYYGGWDVGSYDPQYSEELGAPPIEVFADGGSSDLAPCPDIRTTAGSLAADPAAIRPRLCLAEFIRRKGFDGWNETYDARYNRVVRGRDGFSGKPAERIAIYQAIIASPAAIADDRAFALNRAIRCFAPSGYSSCGGNEIPVEQRKAWFQRLKRDYPQTSWARDLKYYW